MDRQASVLLADDMVVSLVGKITLSGIYTSDIIIPSDPSTVGQFVFLFSLETDINDPFTNIELQVTLPGRPTDTSSVSIPQNQFAPGHTRFVLRQPLLIQQPLLRPGPIQAKVIHDKGAIEIFSLPRITLPHATTISVSDRTDAEKPVR
jgi:hypothetical protein